MKRFLLVFGFMMTRLLELLVDARFFLALTRLDFSSLLLLDLRTHLAESPVNFAVPKSSFLLIYRIVHGISLYFDIPSIAFN